jgi:hypothetical protein
MLLLKVEGRGIVNSLLFYSLAMLNDSVGVVLVQLAG